MNIAALLDNTDTNTRLVTVKNLARLKNADYIGKFSDMAMHDDSTAVRAQAAAALGRMRSKEAVPCLIAILDDSDPKVVCQAVRELLVFKGDALIDDRLKELINHENETVREVIHKAYFENANKGNLKVVDSNAKREPYFPDFMRNVVVNSDVEDALRLVPDESIHLTFTSPPYYNARDYSIYKSYEEYLDFLERVFHEVHRVTKEGRFLIVNTSPIIIPRVGRQYASHRYPIPFDLHARIVDMDGGAAWEFIDDIVWLKPEYSVKNRVAGFEQHRKPLAYKPNAVTEYLMVYRKKTNRLLD